MTPDDLERVIRRDPAGRGLLSGQGADDLCRGHLGAAAESLATASAVGIVTGFYVRDATPPAAETDGLSGSIVLADVLRSAGIDVVLITDELCAGALHAGLSAASCRGFDVPVSPSGAEAATAWRHAFWGEHADLTHLVAIERAGPSAADGRCHNMRGVDIHDTTADMHLLFEQLPHSDIRTVGICDGGNEIGAGSIPSDRLAVAIAGDHGRQIACRTATDWTILAGVSDWGAFALAAAFCLAQDDTSPLLQWPGDRIERLLLGAVSAGLAIDGITRRSKPTVDGLPFITYIQPWMLILRQLGLNSSL